MSTIRDQEQGYRRGLVLGLTMAEVAVLVIFVLLLVMATLLQLRGRETADLEHRARDLRALAAAIDEITARTGLDQEAILRTVQTMMQTQDRLAQAEKERDRLKELEDRLKAAAEEARADMGSPIPDTFRELLWLRHAIVSSGVTPTPEKVQQALALAAAAAEQKPEPPPRNEPTPKPEEYDRLLHELKTLQGQMTNLRRQAESRGRGLDHPPCWASPDGKPEYIFDIALTSQGLRLRDRFLPNRQMDRIALPLDGIIFNIEVPPQRFLEISAPLFQWSVKHECRFVVRAFDTTAPTEKEAYKRHMTTLEQHFYKYEERNERF